MKLQFYIALFLGSLSFSCKPDYLNLQVTTKSIGSTMQIEYMSFVSKDTIFLCGGTKNVNGAIYKSTDGGTNWTQVFQCSDKINALYFYGNGKDVLAVGDSTRIQKSYDGGKTWPKLILNSASMSPWVNDMSAITRVTSFDGTGAITISNNDHERGNIYYSMNTGENWLDIQGNNGLRDWWVFHHDSIIAVGYGIVEKIIYQNKQGNKPIVTPLAIEGDYYTGIWFTSDNVGYLSGFDGGIYKTSDAGKSWKILYKKNQFLEKRIHFNAILFVNESIGYIVGENGLCMKTTNQGSTWINVKMPTSDALLGLFFYYFTLFIFFVNGKYY